MFDDLIGLCGLGDQANRTCRHAAVPPDALRKGHLISGSDRHRDEKSRRRGRTQRFDERLEVGVVDRVLPIEVDAVVTPFGAGGDHVYDQLSAIGRGRRALEELRSRYPADFSSEVQAVRH